MLEQQSMNMFRSNVYKDDRKDDESGTGGRTRVRHPYSWTDAEKQTAFQGGIIFDLQVLLKKKISIIN